jgi:elongation factor P--beta-lysine ligase
MVNIYSISMGFTNEHWGKPSQVWFLMMFYWQTYGDYTKHVTRMWILVRMERLDL